MRGGIERGVSGIREMSHKRRLGGGSGHKATLRVDNDTGRLGTGTRQPWKMGERRDRGGVRWPQALLLLFND